MHFLRIDVAGDAKEEVCQKAGDYALFKKKRGRKRAQAGFLLSVFG
jgi:hypothetical protein